MKSRRGLPMRDHLSNAFYGVLDYVAWPAGMLVVAPVAIRTLGVDRYGIWVIASSVISTGAIVASGFGDANTRYVAMQRASGNLDAQRRSVRSSMGIHLALGMALALAGMTLAPAMTDRLVGPHSPLRSDCVWSLRLACLLLLMRALETVCISTQRAFERYGAAVRLSLMGRMMSLAAVVALPLLRPSVADILAATAAISLGSLWLQLASLKRLLHASCLPPRMDRETTRALLGFGKFTWMQAVSALLIGQADRLITGAALGAAAVTSYAMCVQLSQPVYGITAAGLHFLFPRISAQFARNDEIGVGRSVRAAVLVNWAAVAAGTAVLYFFGAAILRLWAGPALAPAAASILPVVLYSTALSALAIAGMYAMLAMGRPRVVTWLNVVGAAVMLLAVWWLLPRYGVRGMALARLTYGPICLGIYVPLFMQIGRRAASALGRETRAALCEEAR
jgi:O-antigen/teichoic acid export membrane protein